MILKKASRFLRLKNETAIVRRNGRYMVILRQYQTLVGARVWEDEWRILPARFLSKAQAAELENNIDAYLRGAYTPVCER